MGKFFGTDGIRGVANTYPMNVETAVAAGRAIAHHVKSANGDKEFIIIGQDTRLSGDMIAQAVGAGICSAGLDASFIGVIPTPAVAFLASQCGAAAGVVPATPGGSHGALARRPRDQRPAAPGKHFRAPRPREGGRSDSGHRRSRPRSR